MPNTLNYQDTTASIHNDLRERFNPGLHGDCYCPDRNEARISRDLCTGRTIIDAGNGNDNIYVRNARDGGLNVNVNGQNYYFTAEESQNLVIRGGNGNDNIRVDPRVRQNLIIEGGNGNDRIQGGSGNDQIYGGAGNDVIRGGRGNDAIWGGAGNDRIWGQAGHDRIHGGSGNDYLNGGRGNDSLTGGTGCDNLQGGPGFDRENWGNNGLFDRWTQDRDGAPRGWEVPIGGHTRPPRCGTPAPQPCPPDHIFYPLPVGPGIPFEPLPMPEPPIGCFPEPLPMPEPLPWQPPGNCWIPPFMREREATVTERPDGRLVLNAGAGDDNIRVSNGFNGGIVVTVNGERHYFSAQDARRLEIQGGSGNDRISVDPNVRIGLTLRGGSGNDTITGGSGSDRIFGGSGNDTLNGGAGNDYINGGNGHDTIHGGQGHDTLIGGNGNDYISGGRGDDYISGGNGHDTLIGGAGNDYINGGNGNDYISGGYGNDTLNGGRGWDTIRGDQGFDRISGGENTRFRLMRAL